MPIKNSHVIVSYGKQLPRNVLTLVFTFVLLFSACGPQVRQHSPAIQEQFIVNSSVAINTFTPVPVSQTTPQVQNVYALVAPFPTVTDGVTSAELNQAWTQGIAPTAFRGHPLLMDESTLDAVSALWDAPAPGLVRTVAADQLLDTAWAEPGSWAIVPFDALEPKWKVLTVDGQSPIRKNFDISNYPLVLTVDSQISNYNPTKLTTIIMTGVTALVRATA